MSQETERLEHLLSCAKQGDQAAVDALFKEYWGILRTIVAARKQRMGFALHARELTEDLFHDVAMRLLRELPKHHWHGRGAFLAWVKQLARAEIVDRQRYHAAAKRTPDAEAEYSDQPNREASPESQVAMQTDLSALKEDLLTLKEDYSASLSMHHLGYSHHEIGDMLNCTPEAARKLVSRAHAKLAKVRAKRVKRHSTLASASMTRN